MGDRSLLQTPPPTMRSGVLEALEPLGRDNNCLPLQAVIVKNGKIFLDSIDALDDGANDENRLFEEEIERLTGGDDDDYMGSSKFSQEAFDSFMRSNDSDDDLGDVMVYNELPQPTEELDAVNGEIDFEHENYIKYEYHTSQSYEDSTDMVMSRFHELSYAVNDEDSLSGSRGLLMTNEDGGLRVQTMVGYHRRRDSLSLEEYSTFDEDVDRLLSEDLDTSWRYVPLYPDKYYSSGQEVQRVSIITDLPSLLQDNKAECMRRVVPKIREVLHVADIDMQLAAATAFLHILEKKLVTVDEYKVTFLQTVLSSVDNKNEDVANAWLETLLNCIDLLPVEVVKKDVLSIAVNKGQLCQTVQARLSCCKILGKVSSKFENIVVKNDVLPVVLSLCGDVEYEVRACMCQRLDVVAHGLGLELTKSKLLPQLIELSEDESQNVMCSCLETTANIIDMLDREANVNAIIPMVKVLLEKAFNNVETTLPVASRLLGRLCHSLLEYMTVDDKAYFQEYFKKLCRTGLSEKKNKNDKEKLMETADMFEIVTYVGTETRQNAAYNFPAMVLFVEANLFRTELYSCFSHLCRDPHLIVRKTLAMGFHEVAKLLGSKVGIVFPELNYLLSSTDIEILKAIVPNFQDIMSPLIDLGSDHFTEHRALAVQDVVSNFLRAERIVFSSSCWRTQEAMMQSMQCLHYLCTNDYIYEKVVPLLVDKLRTGRALPVKVSAAMTVSVLCRHLKYKFQREEVIQTLIDEFHQSKSCYQRSLFIDLARCYLQVNSKQAFKDNFFDYVLDLKSDPVATVRLKTITIFPDMKRSLMLPRDQNLRMSLDTALRQIVVYDKDTDVQYAAHKMLEEFSVIQEGSDSVRANKKNLTVEDKEDLQKENEEIEIISREEKEKKEEEARTVRVGEKRNSISSGTKKDAQSKIPATRKSSGPLKAPSGLGSKKDSTAKPESLTPGSNTNKEQRPSTPPKKEPVRRIPVLIASKTASTPVLTGTTANKKSSSPTIRNSQSFNLTTSVQSPGVTSTKKGSVNNLSSPSLGTVASAAVSNCLNNDTAVKVKAVTTPSKASSASAGLATRAPKKASK